MIEVQELLKTKIEILEQDNKRLTDDYVKLAEIHVEAIDNFGEFVKKTRNLNYKFLALSFLWIILSAWQIYRIVKGM